jgi:hypothetical protein
VRHNTHDPHRMGAIATRRHRRRWRARFQFRRIHGSDLLAPSVYRSRRNPFARYRARMEFHPRAATFYRAAIHSARPDCRCGTISGARTLLNFPPQLHVILRRRPEQYRLRAKDIQMFDTLWVTPRAPIQRLGPICECCGLRMLVARIAPHPNGQSRALLCSYECVCGAKTSRNEE